MIFGIFTELAPDVLVAESVEQVVTRQNGLKQPHIMVRSRIETSIASLSDYFSLGEPFYPLVGRRRVIDDREGFEIPLIGGSCDAFELVEIRNAFVHGTPHHAAAPVSFPQSTDAKLTRIVDDGLNPQDLAELVVHFQPVVFHAMLDACSWITFLLAVGEDLSLEVAMQLAAEERQNVIRPEVHHRVIEKPPIEGGQFGPTAEDDVGAVLDLGSGPVVVAIFEPFLAQDRVDLTSPAIELPNPRQAAELIGQLLGFIGIIQLGEGIVALAEPNPLLVHLAGEPVVTVDVDLNSVREPGLDTDVHQAELGVDTVVVENPLGTVSELQVGTTLAVPELDGAAGFLAAEYGDETTADGVAPDNVLDEGLLAKSPLTVLVGPPRALGESLGMADQRLGMIFEHRDKVLAANMHNPIDIRVQMGVIAKGKISLENDSIKAAQCCYNGRSEFLDKGTHGVLLWDGCLVTPS